MANPFFDAVDPFGMTGWEPQNGGDAGDQTVQTAVALNKNGDCFAKQEYDAKSEISCTYKGNVSGLALPAVGELKNGYHIDSYTVTWTQNDFCQLVVNGHKHIGGKPDKDCRTYVGSIQTAGGFGCPDALGPFELSADAEIGVRTFTYTVQANHVDELQGNGTHLAGDNYDGTEQLNVELTGEYGGFTSKDGWTVDTKSKARSNTGATTSSATYTKHIAAAA